jgi:hypothetical protein
MLWKKPHSSWAWKLVPLDGGHTRLISRLKQRYEWRAAPGTDHVAQTRNGARFGER